MNWLITVKKCANQDDIDTLLRYLGCERDEESSPIPLGDDEEVIAVSGPRDLPEKAKGQQYILNVSPNSSQTLY